MSESVDFHRARRPEQITVRREAILAAAAALFGQEGPEGTSLNAIAARAGFTKSNVYRYFESREAVLLSLFLEDFADLAGELERTLPDGPAGDPVAAAHAVAAAFLARPRLCQLLGMLASVLERNVSEAAVVMLKTTMLMTAGRISAAMARALPQFSLEDCSWVTGVIGIFVSGLWPAANPSPLVAGVLARPEFEAMKLTAARDLERTILVLLRGLAH
ncbi:MAG: TetR/AcrR family transcriptional regulator [Devosia sp.]|nr:TetR/AcrR family transcriptional regulator [Devosia sp.]